MLTTSEIIGIYYLLFRPQIVGRTTPNIQKRLNSLNPLPKMACKHFITQNRFSLFNSQNLDDQNNELSENTICKPVEDTINPTESKPSSPIYINLVDDFKSFCAKI